MRVLNVDQMVPIHFESWEHFTEHQADLAKVFDDEKVSDKVFWLTPGEETPVVVGYGGPEQ
ncbi:hypothetical protein N7527_010834 [Penicillium freii]|nr:hypothetical protein N7527_010834 [Penicillium freii]